MRRPEIMVLFLSGFFILGCSNGSKHNDGLDSTSTEGDQLNDSANDRDSKVIKALVANGSDVSKPHEIDFFFDFESFESAAKVAQSLDRDDFAVKLFKNDDGTHTIEAKKTLIPEASTMQQLTKQFNALTDEYGGNYDGWGTEVVD